MFSAKITGYPSASSQYLSAVNAFSALGLDGDHIAYYTQYYTRCRSEWRFVTLEKKMSCCSRYNFIRNVRNFLMVSIK